MAKRKLFIDTDAGTDDAVALIMAIRHPDISILGISTSGGNVPLDKVVQNVLYVRELCNSNIPVYRGEAKPLKRSLGTADFIHGKDGLGDIGLNLTGRRPDKGNATQRLIDAIKANPHEVELICLGPLTNIAHAINQDPETISKVKRIYIMGGLVTLPGNVTPLAEYNIWADPEAADIVLKAPVRCTMIGWDTTLNCSDFSLDELEEIRNIKTKYAIFAADIQQQRIKWMRAHAEKVAVNLADVLAMAVVLDDSLVIDRRDYSMHVKGGEDNSEFRGFIEASSCSAGFCTDYIHKVDRARFFEFIKRSLG